MVEVGIMKRSKQKIRTKNTGTTHKSNGDNYIRMAELVPIHIVGKKTLQDKDPLYNYNMKDDFVVRV